jgi:hypothetical protein
LLAVLAASLAMAAPAGGYIIRATCFDGVPDSVVARGARTELAVPRCDLDGERDGRCTFALYFGCEPPSLCLGTDREVVLARRVRRRFTSPSFPQTYVLRCRRRE